MTKWADYCISAVHYNSDHSRIIQCRVFPDLGNNFGNLTEQSRQLIVNNLLNNFSYVTLPRDSQGTISKGDNVICYTLNGEYFIRTDGNRTTRDNLGELPEY